MIEKQNYVDNQKFTDMYLIAALLSYGYKLLSSDRKNLNRQEFVFQSSYETVYVRDLNGEVYTENLSLQDASIYYQSKRLLLLGSYPDVLRGLKQDIISHKVNDDKK